MATISVLMPVYNAQRYVAEAVESILAQTFTDFEFLIIDDGSTDRSREILEGYARRDKRIHLISRPNTGYCRALNEMLGLARGELLARMDADDVALPERFARQVDYLRAHPECVAVGSRVLLIDPDGDPLTPFLKHLTHEEIDGAHLAGKGGSLVHPSAMMRRAAVEAIGGYRVEAEPVEDLDLFLRLAEHGRLANLPEVLLRYRRHHAAVGYSRMEEQMKRLGDVVREARQRRGLEAAIPTLRIVNQPGENHRVWAWWALNAGNVRTARKHALMALWHAPLAPKSWHQVLCVLRDSLLPHASRADRAPQEI